MGTYAEMCIKTHSGCLQLWVNPFKVGTWKQLRADIKIGDGQGCQLGLKVDGCNKLSSCDVNLSNIANFSAYRVNRNRIAFAKQVLVNRGPGGINCDRNWEIF